MTEFKFKNESMLIFLLFLSGLAHLDNFSKLRGWREEEKELAGEFSLEELPELGPVAVVTQSPDGDAAEITLVDKVIFETKGTFIFVVNLLSFAIFLISNPGS